MPTVAGSQNRIPFRKLELRRLNEEILAYVDGAIRTALAEYAMARKWGLPRLPRNRDHSLRDV
jgi:hypothetical protein